MRQLFCYLLLSIGCLGFGQNQAITFNLENTHFDITGAVKSIRITKLGVSTNDTVRMLFKASYSKKGKIQRVDFYRNTFEAHTGHILYDQKGRMVRQTRRHGDTIRLVEQFFSKNRELPDSSVIYWSDKRIGEHRNHFSKNKISLHEEFSNGKLELSYRYEYYPDGQLKRKVFINTENGPGITFGSSITGGAEEKHSYPNDTTFYEYSTIHDTVIKKQWFNSRLTEIVRTYKSNDFTSVSIEREPEETQNYRIETTVTYQDSSVRTSLGYVSGKLERRFVTITKNDGIVSVWNPSLSTNKNDITTITRYETVYDRRKNWVTKKKYASGKLVQIIEREIDYY